MIKTKSQGILTVISGPSGCGKDTIVKKVLEDTKDIWICVSCTTRPPRGKEEDGKDYFFLSKEEFEEKIEKGDFLEYASYAGNYYGTPKSEIQKHLDKGENVILVIDIQGALSIKDILPDTLFIFILPPTMRELKKRLEGRQTETHEKVVERFKKAYEEINEVTKYNYVVINDKVENAALKVKSILIAEHSRVDRIEQVFLNNPEEEMHEILLEDEKTFINEKAEIK